MTECWNLILLLLNLTILVVNDRKVVKNHIFVLQILIITKLYEYYRNISAAPG